jgi:hypothetical protein
MNKQDIIYTQLKYIASEGTFYTTIKVYNIDGTLEFDKTEVNTQAREICNDMHFFIGGYSSHNQFSNFVIYEQILHKRSLTESELTNRVTFLSEKWNV